MQLHSLIVDDFLEDFEGWRLWADAIRYEGVKNPVDGVVYPGIYAKLPTYGVVNRLSAIMEAPIKLNTLFLRLSLKDVPVPHQAHTDSVMGQWSMMLYMNRPEHCLGGTSLVRHVTGMDTDPRNKEQDSLWTRDTNDPSKWTPYTTCEMRSNRAFVFRANLMHRAEPVGGFGTDATNGRLVMTAFFNL